LKARIEIASERALVKKCIQGDQRSYKELFDIFKDRIFSTAVRILNNEQDAEDASQEIFIKVFSNIHKFRGDSSLVTWIYRIAVNTCLDIVRKRKSDVQTDESEIELEKLFHSGKSRSYRASYTIIEKEIRMLPKSCRTVFILYAIEGFKHEEVAKILEISTGTSKSQYFTAKNLLRKKLLPYREILKNGL